MPMLIFCKTDEHDETMAKAAELVSSERRKKAFRLPTRRARANSLAAELLARYTLKESGYAPELLYFDKSGRPRVRDDTAFISLSHSGEYVACAVDDTIVGVDIQKIKSVGRLVIARVCTPAEQEQVKSDEDIMRAFTRLWTLKEAWRKANPDVPTRDMFKGEFVFRNDGTIKGPPGFEYMVSEDIEGYIIALCTAK